MKAQRQKIPQLPKLLCSRNSSVCPSVELPGSVTKNTKNKQRWQSQSPGTVPHSFASDRGQKRCLYTNRNSLMTNGNPSRVNLVVKSAEQMEWPRSQCEPRLGSVSGAAKSCPRSCSRCRLRCCCYRTARDNRGHSVHVVSDAGLITGGGGVPVAETSRTRDKGVFSVSRGCFSPTRALE